MNAGDLPSAALPESPPRSVSGAREMRALAHPVRIALLEALAREGTLTATEAGDCVGESAANCSFHLRTLAKYGFVEEVPGVSGRRRPWRRTGTGITFSLDNDEPAADVAAHELERHFDAQRQQRRDEWLATRRSYPPAWQDAAFTMGALAYLTADELAALNADLVALLGRYRPRTLDRHLRPDDALPVSFTARAHPVPPTPSGN